MLLVKVLNYLTDFNKTPYERYAIESDPNMIHFGFQKLLISPWRTPEFVKWEGHYFQLIQMLQLCMKYNFWKYIKLINNFTLLQNVKQKHGGYKIFS
jgi:hypothetical protein